MDTDTRLPVCFSHLRTEELTYEMQIRGYNVPAMEDIPEFLTHWDDIVHSPVDVSRGVHDPVSMLNQLHVKLVELDDIFSDLNSFEVGLPNTLLRVTSRVNHLSNLVQDVLSWQLIAPLRRDFLLVASRLTGFQIQLANLSARPASGSIPTLREATSVPRSLSSTVTPVPDGVNTLVGERPLSVPVLERAVAGSTVPISSVPPLVPGNRPSVSNVHSGDYGPRFEQSFPLYKSVQRENPIEEILRSAGEYHVEDPSLILGFFQVMVRLIQCLSLVSFGDNDLYNMLASVSVRALRACVLSAKEQAWPIRRFHSYIFDKYVPQFVLQRWLSEYYYRVQGPTESLSDYIEAKKFFASVLLVADDESRVVLSIVQGLNAYTRSRIVFATQPRAFTELYDLAAQVSTYALVDSFSHQAFPPPVGHSPTTPQENRARRPVTCYSCRRPGHVARDCPRRAPQSRDVPLPASLPPNSANVSPSPQTQL